MNEFYSPIYRIYVKREATDGPWEPTVWALSLDEAERVGQRLQEETGLEVTAVRYEAMEQVIV